MRLATTASSTKGLLVSPSAMQPSPGEEPFTRLNCACVFLDSAAQLERDAQRVAEAMRAACESAAAGDAKRIMPFKEALAALRAELAAVRQSHHEHVTVVKVSRRRAAAATALTCGFGQANYLRSMMGECGHRFVFLRPLTRAQELSKYHEINPMDQSTPGLQTSAYRRGDLTRLRNPPKKLTKKDKAAAAKKRTAQQAAKARKRTADADAAKTRRVRQRIAAADPEDDDDDGGGDSDIGEDGDNAKAAAAASKTKKKKKPTAPKRAAAKKPAAKPTVKPVPLALTVVRLTPRPPPPPPPPASSE